MSHARLPDQPEWSLTEADPPRRRRDASRTRADLLEAATELFGQHGYAATTLRAIGERAGVDAALVARYFGNKEALYLESITELPIPDDEDGPLGRAATTRTVERVRAGGITPVARIAVTGTDDEAVRARVGQVLRDRTISRVANQLEGAGTDQALLRAEVATAVMLGVSMAYSAEVFMELANAEASEVIDLCLAAVDAVLTHDLENR